MSGTLEHKRAATKAVKRLGLQADLRAKAVVLVAADSTVGNSLRDLIQLNEDDPALKSLVEEYFRGEGAVSDGHLDDHSKSIVREVLQQQSTLPAKGFSKANSSDAEDLLDELELTEVLGNDIEPILVPTNVVNVPRFDFSAYPNENAALEDLLQYHQRQLEQYGASFGRGGFRIYDIHTQQRSWSIRSNKCQLSGVADLCVASHGLSLNSATRRAFVVYEHKQTAEQKEAYRSAHAILAQDQTRRPTMPGYVAFSTHRGQCISSCLGAYAYNRFPLLLDLTDGQVHHMIRVSGSQLILWGDLTPQQAYYKQAEILKAASTSYPGLALRTLEGVPEEEQAPMKKCRSLRPSGGLLEQLDSVVPFMAEHEQVSCAQEIIASWEIAKSLPMSSVAQSMYS